jgi:hypothetical protein
VREKCCHNNDQDLHFCVYADTAPLEKAYLSMYIHEDPSITNKVDIFAVRRKNFFALYTFREKYVLRIRIRTLIQFRHIFNNQQTIILLEQRNLHKWGSTWVIFENMLFRLPTTFLVTLRDRTEIYFYAFCFSWIWSKERRNVKYDKEVAQINVDSNVESYFLLLVGNLIISWVSKTYAFQTYVEFQWFQLDVVFFSSFEMTGTHR